MFKKSKENMMDFRDYVSQYKGKQIYIQTHNYPDPDALGSAYGLQKLCEHFGVQSILCYDGKIDKLNTRRILSIFGIEIFPKDEVPGLNKDSIIFLVDTQKDAGNVTDFIGEEVACIDHHPTIKKIEYEFMDVRMVGACATIICQYFMKYGLTPDPITAAALLYGIKMDTNHFQRGVCADDIEAFAFLNSIADPNALIDVTNTTMEFSDLNAYSASFSTIKVYDQVGIAYIPFPCNDALIAMISDFIHSLEEVKFAVVYSKRETDWKFSVRSELPKLDSGVVIRKALLSLGGTGGGHHAMAGGALPINVVKALGPEADNIIYSKFVEVTSELRNK